VHASEEEWVEPTSVILAIEDPALQEEVLHYLDRIPRIRVVDAAADGPSLGGRIRERRADVAVVSPSVVRETADLDRAALLVVSARETTEELRTALGAGARGFYLWPEERDSLARDTLVSARPSTRESDRSGRVVAVYGPRGGSGVTFLATNLAAACADRGTEVVLADLDFLYGDVTVALGVVEDQATSTAADLAPVLDELTHEHIRRVLHAHPRGFHVLLAPHEPTSAPPLGPSHVARLAALLRAGFDLALFHVPRGLDGGGRAALEASDEVLLVVTLDVLAIRDAKRALGLLETWGIADRCRLVVNRVARTEVLPEDAERVLGLRAEALIRSDRQVERTQNRGELIAGRSGPAARRLVSLAARIAEGAR
jgi:pilus assembly protein CpaE